MVLFFCMFLALRSQDCGKTVTDIRDSELSGEVEVYGGQIMDDNFLHVLKILRDRSSKAIRLQASVLRGEMKRTPVWTAFIHHQISSRRWIERPGPKIIYFSGTEKIRLFRRIYPTKNRQRGKCA
jgi:hypothetical protein